MVDEALAAWRGLKPPQKLGVAAAAALVVAGLVVLGVTSAGPSTARLVPPEGVPQQRVLETLAGERIPFEVKADGIHVARADQDRAFQALYTRGLANDYNAVFENSLWETSGDRKIRFQLALQERLARDIRSLASIQDASVTITPAAPSAVLGDRGGISAKASVVVTLAPGREALDASEAAGIANLVASSVFGLDPKAVSILDRSGRAYSASAAPVVAGLPEQLRLKERFERDYEDKVSRHLVRFYPGTIVSANVRLAGRTEPEDASEEPFSGPVKAPYEEVDVRYVGATAPAVPAPSMTVGPWGIDKATLWITIPFPGGSAPPETPDKIAEMAAFAADIPRENIQVRFAPVSAHPAESAGFPVAAAGIGAAVVLAALVAMLRRRRGSRRKTARRREPEDPEPQAQSLREFVGARLSGAPDHGARVLAEMDATRAAMVLSGLDDFTSARISERLDRATLARIAAAGSKLRARAPHPSDALSALTECAEALVLPR